MIAITCPIILIFGFCVSNVLNSLVDNCYPAINPTMPQHIIGYGSLMNNKSKLRTDSTAGPSIPVRIRGFRRRWDSQGDSTVQKSPTTFLGMQRDPASSFNAVSFTVYPSKTTPNPVAAYDFREDWYCRQRVDLDQIEFLAVSNSAEDKSTQGEFWIYVTRKEKSKVPDEQHPIRLGYVDTFLSGCLEVEDQFKLNGFAAECVKSTYDWGDHWLSNREPLVTSQNGNTSVENEEKTRERVDALLRDGIPGYSDIKFITASSTGSIMYFNMFGHLLFFYSLTICLSKY